MLPKNAELWLPGWFRHWRRHESRPPSHVYLAITDHYEPGWRGADWETQCARVRAWEDTYPAIASRHADSNGRPPQHSFFYPEEEYAPEHLEALARLHRAGFGDVEIHLHHDRDTAAQLTGSIERFKEILHSRHGLLRKDAQGRLIYAFIHGNFALNNALPGGRWCGIDNETRVLLDTGCYADLTYPCAPHPGQPRLVNSIYYIEPRPTPRSQDGGIPARAGQAPPVGLLTIQGPLALNFRKRKWGLMPRVDNADINHTNPPAAERIALWIATGVHVLGAPDHVFIKLSAHGAQENNLRVLLHGGLETLWSELERLSRGPEGFQLHYVTAFEMYQRVKQLEASGVQAPRNGRQSGAGS